MENYRKKSLDIVDELLCSLNSIEPFYFRSQEINKKMVKTMDEWNEIREELKNYPIFLIYQSHDIDENVIRENEDQFDWNLLSSCQSGFSEEFLNEYKEKYVVKTMNEIMEMEGEEGYPIENLDEELLWDDYRKGYINKEQLLELAKPLMKTEYGQYLVKVSKEVK